MTCWLKYYIRRSNAIVARSCEAGGRLRQRHGLIVKGKRISCPPHYAPPNNDYDPPHHDYEHGFPLIRSLRASAQRSTSVLFSFVLSLLIMTASSAIRQSKTILARSCEAGWGQSSKIRRRLDQMTTGKRMFEKRFEAFQLARPIPPGFFIHRFIHRWNFLGVI